MEALKALNTKVNEEYCVESSIFCGPLQGRFFQHILSFDNLIRQDILVVEGNVKRCFWCLCQLVRDLSCCSPLVYVAGLLQNVVNIVSSCLRNLLINLPSRSSRHSN